MRVNSQDEVRAVCTRDTQNRRDSLRLVAVNAVEQPPSRIHVIFVPLLRNPHVNHYHDSLFHLFLTQYWMQWEVCIEEEKHSHEVGCRIQLVVPCRNVSVPSQGSPLKMIENCVVVQLESVCVRIEPYVPRSFQYESRHNTLQLPVVLNKRLSIVNIRHQQRVNLQR